MENCITFLALSRNDVDGEQKRLNLFVDSLLAQNNSNWKLIFFDGTRKKDNPLKIIQHPNIIYLYQPIEDPRDWCAPYIRNCLALKVETNILCHTNPDCIFTNNFVEELIKKCKENIMVQCRRIDHPASVKIDTIQDAFKFLQDAPILRHQAYGECQCMHTKKFIKIGGYYNAIKNNESTFPNHGMREDTWLYKYSNNSHGLKVVFLTNAKILHLKHPRRSGKFSYDQHKEDKVKII